MTIDARERSIDALTLPPEQKEAFRTECARRGLSMAQGLDQALRLWATCPAAPEQEPDQLAIGDRVRVKAEFLPDFYNKVGVVTHIEYTHAQPKETLYQVQVEGEAAHFLRLELQREGE